MLWSPWEAVPECSPQIQAWDYLGGYYIRCRGNFRDSNFQNHLASAGPTTCCHCLRRVHLYTGTPVRASLRPKKLQCTDGCALVSMEDRAWTAAMRPFAAPAAAHPQVLRLRHQTVRR